jgi:hypothetical protein
MPQVIAHCPGSNSVEKSGLAGSRLQSIGVSRMATIVGGIGTSHTPTIGFALDTHKQNDNVWAPIFKGYEPVQDWLAQKRPDVLLFIFNDHVTSFFFDH